MINSADTFYLEFVHDNFEASLIDEDDIHLKSYLDSYRELNKFFTLMGTIFSFVSQDLEAKIDILSQLQSDSPTAPHFETVKGMIEYEISNNLLKKNEYVSGSRTLLRLHRGLDFIREFLKRVCTLDEDANTSSACREAYDNTLSKHHPFLIRKAAKIAMYSLPTKKNLLKRVIGDEERVKNALDILPKTLDHTAKVYNRIETIYTVKDLHQLP